MGIPAYGEVPGRRLGTAVRRRGLGVLDRRPRPSTRALAQLVGTTWRRLDGRPEDTTRVSYSGGAVSAGELITAPLREALGREPGTFELQPPRYAPVVGAAIYAAALHGTPLDDDALARLDAITARS